MRSPRRPRSKARSSRRRALHRTANRDFPCAAREIEGARATAGGVVVLFDERIQGGNEAQDSIRADGYATCGLRIRADGRSSRLTVAGAGD